MTARDNAAAVRAPALAAAFEERFGRRPRVFRAPSRIILLGEQTDYNGGFTLAVAADVFCYVAAAPRSDRRLVVHAVDRAETFEALIDAPEERSGSWRDHVTAIARALSRDGAALHGADILVDNDRSPGAESGWAAARQVATALALLDAAGEQLDSTVLARLCHRTENGIAGTPRGITDAYVACHARAGTTMLLDCARPEHHYIPLSPDLRIVTCHTNAIASGEFARRRSECREAVARIAAVLPGIRSLRDVTSEHLAVARSALDAILFQRVRHVVTENQRVHRMAAALDARDLAALAPLMHESHRSLADDFDVSCPRLDRLVETASRLPGVYGARLTEADSGGATVNLVAAAAVPQFCATLPEAYRQRTGLTVQTRITIPSGAAGRL